MSAINTSLVGDVAVTQICGLRDRAIERMEQALQHYVEAYRLAEEARATATRAAAGHVFHLNDRTQDSEYRRLFEPIDVDASRSTFRAATDAAVWQHILAATGMEALMDATARDEFMKQLATDVPAVNEANITATLDGLRGDAALVFQRGLARAFSGLDRRFKSHDAFKLGDRIIITHVFDSWGHTSYYSKQWPTIADVERVLAVLDGQPPAPGALRAAVQQSRGTGMSPRQGCAETPYLRIRTFKNGNAHLWFTRDDLVTKANLVLAAYYGQVLPDAVGADAPDEVRSGLPSRDLAYYPTPPAVVQALVEDLHLARGARVLEPSAGTGNIARALMLRGYKVDAVEIDAGRVAELRQHAGLTVHAGNFLRMQPRPDYAAVVMNPPFAGTHWMDHVRHAFEWLAPGGVLLAVIPVSFELGSSERHERFREWALARSRYRDRCSFRDLPDESFAASGTRVATGLLTLHAPYTTA